MEQLKNLVAQLKVEEAEDFVASYIQTNITDAKKMHEISIALCGYPIGYTKEQINVSEHMSKYIVDVSCLYGYLPTIYDLGFAYEGLDGDYADELEIKPNPVVALQLYRYVVDHGLVTDTAFVTSKFLACSQIVYLCEHHVQYFGRSVTFDFVDLARQYLRKGWVLFHKDGTMTNDEQCHFYSLIVQFLEKTCSEYQEAHAWLHSNPHITPETPDHDPATCDQCGLTPQSAPVTSIDKSHP